MYQVCHAVQRHRTPRHGTGTDVQDVNIHAPNACTPAFGKHSRIVIRSSRVAAQPWDEVRGAEA